MIVLPITANEGLSNNTVWAVLQDKSGFIWIGTVDGLDRYDGNEIRHFAPDSLIGENNSV
ncbi:two-component regulator propeller domain-containing protein, partial [Klebsiella pneumoniae]|uniref:two-component regulator propeller domain-containing protein n=1 Tax=Klebsiella pneumoniae TaxID=573 RepID=UPI0034D97F17